MSYRRYQRSDNRPRGPIHPREAFFVALLLVMMGFLSNPRSFFEGILQLIPLFLLVLGIIVLIKWLRASNQEQNTTNELPGALSQIEIEKLNYIRHTARNFYEQLTSGEEVVADTLARELDYGKYYIFNNVIIPSETNGSAQIDHVVVSEFGIFVIESKNYKGWIFGSKEQKFWTQSLSDWAGEKKTFQFQNPLHQNYGHAKTLEKTMPFLAGNLVNIVVFLDKAEFKTELPENVLHLKDLVGYIKKYSTKRVSVEQFIFLIGFLSYRAQLRDISAEEHIENVRRNGKRE